ncbi:MAG: dihydroorotase, partial [Clostridia bacterium]|nr:dihydroorotase [Clostridia bacterium]
GVKDSPCGNVGIETESPLLYTKHEKKGIISIEKLIDLIAVNPRRRFNIPFNGFSVWDLNRQYGIDKKFFLSKGKSSPFIGQNVYGENLLTVYNGKAVYKK